MSFNRARARDHRKALRAVAESEAQSDSDGESGLDIIESSRKDLNISGYIQGLLMRFSDARLHFH